MPGEETTRKFEKLKSLVGRWLELFPVSLSIMRTVTGTH